ncbi:RNA-binding protein rsd1 [Zancudomyces culisetae]|uniref:RNA-binding protein rsd1 n=1 Tax=Zancudomyces culisetae TaxID=1213189 RepID=A0A1R1PF62_ZANCU|nr:RNA-binding protein rsd1 [Zancudomyces culisetae]|eukprot:OMH79543.1 RNA-binding protein rsd1 [Zancudomyces culisetae]
MTYSGFSTKLPGHLEDIFPLFTKLVDYEYETNSTALTRIPDGMKTYEMFEQHPVASSFADAHDKSLSHDWVQCAILHPYTPHCSVGFVHFLKEVFPKSLLIYLPLNFASAVIFKRKALIVDPVRSSTHILKASLRSSTFFALMVACAGTAPCYLKRILGFEHPSIYYVNGLFAGLSVLVEKPSRRMELGMADCRLTIKLNMANRKCKKWRMVQKSRHTKKNENNIRQEEDKKKYTSEKELENDRSHEEMKIRGMGMEPRKQNGSENDVKNGSERAARESEGLQEVEMEDVRETRDRKRNGRSSRERSNESDSRDSRERRRERGRSERYDSRDRRQRDRSRTGSRKRDRYSSRDRVRDFLRDTEEELTRGKAEPRNSLQEKHERDRRTVFINWIGFYSVAYVEFREIESAVKAVELSGQKLLGIPIIVQFSEAEKNRQAQPKEYGIGGVPINNDLTRVRQICVSNIPSAIGSEDLKSLFETFGSVESCVFRTRGETGEPKKAYITYTLSQNADSAAEKMDGFELLGNSIRVWIPRSSEVFSETGAQGPVQPESAANSPAQPAPTTPTVTLQKIPAEEDTKNAATDCILLCNMFDPDEESSDDWVHEIEEDTKDEVCKYGTVTAIKLIPSKLGEIYIKFSSADEAIAASKALDGRWFDGKKVSATFVSSDKYSTIFA